MTSPDGHKLQFALTLGKDLIIEAKNSRTDAALVSRTDATLLKIALGRAIIDAYTKLHAVKIPAVRVLSPIALPSPRAAPAVPNLQ